MSEHHRRSAAVELLSAKRCGLWPDCACHQTLLHWQRRASDEGLIEAPEQLAWAETSIFLTLSCIAERCPSSRYRTYAAMQLLNPWWDRQRRGEELTEEFCERRRAADA
jgi:hypothetical protein